MAGNRFTFNSGLVPMVAATPKCIGMLKAGSAAGLLVRRMTITGNAPAGGTDPAAKVELLYMLTGGAFGTFTSAPPVKDDPAIVEAVVATGGSNATVEPTTGLTATGVEANVNPQGGWVKAFDPPRRLPAGAAYFPRVTTGAASTPSFTVVFECEE